MTMKETCGPKYQRLLTRFTRDTESIAKVFAAGFISGQAEKVYLGACSAAMIRPSADQFTTVMEIVHNVCAVYDLCFRTIDDEEIWIYTLEVADIIDSLENHDHLQINTPEWHFARGMLTGVPANKIDHYFHLRKGFGKPCDNI